MRLMGAYIVKCTGVDKNADGSIAAIHCTADLETGNGQRERVAETIRQHGRGCSPSSGRP